MNEYKIIHFHVFDPHNAIFKSMRNDRAKIFYVECNNSENCELFKRGECSWRAGIGWQACQYGKHHSYEGPTRRASKFSSWISEQKKKFEGVPYLNCHSKVMAFVGDWVFLPYTFMTLDTNVPFLQHDSLFGKDNCFLARQCFTKEMIIELIKFRPQAMMGGEITNYQKEQVPLFIRHLSEKMPDMLKEIINDPANAEIKKIYESLTNIGRTAFLETLTPGVGEFVDIHGGKWEWDGTWLSSKNSHASFVLTGFSEMKMKPLPKEKVKITDERQVNEKTIFTD